MGKVFISEFKKKLAKKTKKASINRQAVSINLKSLHDERTRRFNNGLSKYLANNHIRERVKKINDFTIKLDMSFATTHYGSALNRSISLSLIEINENKELWECVIYQNTDMEENESNVEKFDNAQIAIEYFINQALKSKNKN
tara:strand:- start:36 stop:461 length:426 start_codon:yes stop_codon:yes gene_type:complete